LSGVTSSYTDVAAIPYFPKHGRIVNSNTGLYTCPADKKAKVLGSMTLDALGADATYAIAVKRGSTYFPVGPFIVVGGISRTNDFVSLEETDILTLIGDNGSTNGTSDITIAVQEVSL